MKDNWIIVNPIWSTSQLGHFKNVKISSLSQFVPPTDHQIKEMSGMSDHLELREDLYIKMKKKDHHFQE